MCNNEMKIDIDEWKKATNKQLLIYVNNTQI